MLMRVNFLLGSGILKKRLYIEVYILNDVNFAINNLICNYS